jgi:deazaflavin-dependent oxidoreductase (nitroreductase family)
MHDFSRALMDDLRANGGHASGGPFFGRQVLILTTEGARTGEPRQAPLAYTRDGEDVVIVASMGGSPRHPAWYYNIQAHPTVTIELDGETVTTEAHIADEPERRRLYDQHASMHGSFKEYETMTERVIPVITLRRIEASAAA